MVWIKQWPWPCNPTCLKLHALLVTCWSKCVISKFELYHLSNFLRHHLLLWSLRRHYPIVLALSETGLIDFDACFKWNALFKKHHLACMPSRVFREFHVNFFCCYEYWKWLTYSFTSTLASALLQPLLKKRLLSVSPQTFKGCKFEERVFSYF